MRCEYVIACGRCLQKARPLRYSPRIKAMSQNNPANIFASVIRTWFPVLAVIMAVCLVAALMAHLAGRDSSPDEGSVQPADPYPKLVGFARDIFVDYNTDTANMIFLAQIAYDGDDWSAAAIMDFLAANGVPRDKAWREGSGITIMAYVPVRLLGRLSQLEKVELVVDGTSSLFQPDSFQPDRYQPDRE